MTQPTSDEFDRRLKEDQAFELSLAYKELLLLLGLLILILLREAVL